MSELGTLNHLEVRSRSLTNFWKRSLRERMSDEKFIKDIINDEKELLVQFRNELLPHEELEDSMITEWADNIVKNMSIVEIITPLTIERVEDYLELKIG